MNETCRILVICSANLCRSVTAVEYARRAVENSGRLSTKWTFESAGTEVVRGQRLPSAIAETMDALGVPRRAVPVGVTEDLVRSAHIVLTAERRHRAIVARRFPFAVRYTYTLLQFARLVEAGRLARPELTALSCPDLLSLARSGVSSVQPVDDATIDIVDPVATGSHAAMRECAESVERAFQRIFEIR